MNCEGALDAWKFVANLVEENVSPREVVFEPQSFQFPQRRVESFHAAGAAGTD